MERKQGGCCLAPRYGGATTGQEAWQMGNIMLKFRPIAPKPAAMAPAPMTPPVTTAAAAGAAGKGKRKAAAGGRGRRGRKPKKATTAVAVVTAAAPATQKVDLRKDKPLSSPSSSSSGTTSVDSSTPPPPPPAKEGFSAMLPRPDLAHAHVVLRPVASCVTIESVAATWREGEAPSAAAGGVDEAPAFVSDQWGRVTWMNMAFSRAASAGDAATAPPVPASDAGVVLAARDGAAVPAWGTCAGFTCRVRVTYDACPRRGSLVAPCDVWRLDAGCYLWRLDLQATLTLSLGGLL
uniref:Uncharacterized protein n=1 Tax=Avena sativa TaxID=4498 RepID=A0ACD5UJ71_AVESA